MGIELIRIDDRLIHGQIATTWINNYSIEQVLIINDQILTDKMQQSVISMTAPVNVKVKVFGVDAFLDIYKKTSIQRRTMIILTNSIDAYRLAKGGVDFKVLNVGGMRYENGRVKIAKAVSVTEREREAFEQLLHMGIDVQVQIVPRDELHDMKEILTNTK